MNKVEVVNGSKIGKNNVKVGDVIKVLASDHEGNKYEIGKSYKVADIENDGCPRIKESSSPFDVVTEGFEIVTEPIPTEHIAIFRKKNRIIATITKGEYKFSQSVSLAKCKGDFKTAVKIVIEKLMDKFEVDGVVEEVAKDTDLTAKNFKAKCISTSDCGLTKGKIYEFVNGYSNFDGGAKMPNFEQGGVSIFSNFSDLEKWFSVKGCSKWEEVIEPTVKSETPPFNWESFKLGKFVVHCDTEEKAREFLKECDGNGIKWCGGGEPSERTNFGEYASKTCYCCSDGDSRLGYCGSDFFKRNNKEIIDYTPSPTVKKVKRHAKVGEWIKIIDAQPSESDGQYYVSGDVLKVVKLSSHNNPMADGMRVGIVKSEYVVLENYTPSILEVVSEAVVEVMAEPKTEVKKVNRQAEVGEYIEVIRATHYEENNYRNGDIKKVISVSRNENGIYFDETTTWNYVGDNEYVVLENYQPEVVAPTAETPKFVKAKVGDKIKFVRNFGDFLHGPNINVGDIMTVKVVCVDCVETDTNNVLWDKRQEYEIVETPKAEAPPVNPLSTFTQEQLIKELFNRQGMN